MGRKNDPQDRVYERKGPFRGSLSIFWRLALGSLAVLLVMIGVALYALVQLRQLTTLSTEIVSIHYPAIETAKRLLSSLFAQHASEEKHLAVHDKVFLADFGEEGREFQQALATLLALDRAAERRAALQQVQRRHNEYQTLFRGEPDQHTVLWLEPAADYAVRRDRLITELTSALQGYVRAHEARIGALVAEARSRALDAKVVTEWLVVLSAVLCLALAGAASYSILCPLRRLREHIRAIGQGGFGPSVQIPAPADLQDLVETVNWMAGRLQELDDMKRDFLANVSHELRTPLASIYEGTHLLLDEIPGTLTGEQREALQIIADSSQRLIQLISNLLDCSKMEAGRMEYRIVPTDIKRVAQARSKRSGSWRSAGIFRSWWTPRRAASGFRQTAPASSRRSTTCSRTP